MRLDGQGEPGSGRGEWQGFGVQASERASVDFWSEWWAERVG